MITVLTGNFGSGKTEIAINLALKNSSTLIDLDLVNPYFRSRKAKEKIENRGVKVIVPLSYLANSDLPIVSPLVLGELQRANLNVVIDVGGDDVGAIVLGRFSKILNDKFVNLLLVVNPYRPFTQDLKGVSQIFKDVEQASRMKISALISNPNLGRETTWQDILEGHRKVEGIAKELDKPIQFLCCHKNLLEKVKSFVTIPVMGLEIFMLVPWEE